MRDVFVVGGGLGGMASALRMRAKGYNVTLLERGDALGGRARVFKQDGFTFDAGPTVITAPYLISELFDLFGKKMSDYLDLRSLQHWYRYQFNDGSTFDYVADMDEMYKNIEAIASKQDVEGFKKLLLLSEEIYKEGFVKLSDKSFDSFGFMCKQVPALARVKFYRSVFKTVSCYIKSEKLRRVFTTQPLLVGGDPFKTTSIYLLILYLEQKMGCHFCMGGTHALVSGLEDLMRDVGINIRFHSTVTKITGEGRKIKSIVVNNQEEITTNLVIYNGDPAYAYQNLIEKRYRGLFNRFRMNQLKYSMGLCMYYFGTEVRYEDVALHTISYGQSYRTLLKDVFHKKILNTDLSMYLYRPTSVDPSLAPNGCDGFYVLAPVPNLQSNIDWLTLQDAFKNQIISLLEERLLPGLSNHIVTDKFLTPEYFRSDLLSQFGAGFSLQPIFTQSAYFRFHNRSKRLSGLYFVGAGTHPGAGIPGVLSSAKLVDGLISDKGV